MSRLHTLQRGYKRLSLNEYSGNSPFSPASYGNLMLWLKPDGGLGNLTPGAAVSQWNSYDGTTIASVSQGTGIYQPVVTYTYFGGMPSVLFDGSNDFLSTVGQVTMPASWTAIFLCQSLRTSPTGQLWTNRTAGNYQFRISTNLFAYSNGNSYNSSTFETPTYNVAKMFTAVFEASTLTFYDSLVSKGSGGWGTWVWDAIASQWGAEGTWFQGAMAEIVVYNYALSVADITRLHDNYFKIKYAAAVDLA